MTDAWYLACLEEVEVFLESFAGDDGAKRRVVAIDSDLVAALVGLLQANAIQMQAFRHMAMAGELLEELG